MTYLLSFCLFFLVYNVVGLTSGVFLTIAGFSNETTTTIITLVRVLGFFVIYFWLERRIADGRFSASQIIQFIAAVFTASLISKALYAVANTKEPMIIPLAMLIAAAAAYFIWKVIIPPSPQPHPQDRAAP